MPRRRGRGRPRGSKNKVSVGIPGNMLESLAIYRQQILSEIATLQRHANALSNAMVAMGGAAVPPGMVPRLGRPPGSTAPKLEGGRIRAKKGSLKECIVKVLSKSSKPVAVKDMITGVRRVGYKTNSSSLGNQISMALRVMPQVKKVSHGLYVLS